MCDSESSIGVGRPKLSRPLFRPDLRPSTLDNWTSTIDFDPLPHCDRTLSTTSFVSPSFCLGSRSRFPVVPPVPYPAPRPTTLPVPLRPFLWKHLCSSEVTGVVPRVSPLDSPPSTQNPRLCQRPFTPLSVRKILSTVISSSLRPDTDRHVYPNFFCRKTDSRSEPLLRYGVLSLLVLFVLTPTSFRSKSLPNFR